MSIQTKTILSVLLATAAPVAAIAQNNSLTCGETYVVVSGDSLSKISNRAYGSSDYEGLYRANLETIGQNPDMIMVGQQLMVPCQGNEPAAIVAEAAVETPTAEIVQTATDENLVFTFNKTSAPKFIINSGIIDLYLEEIASVTEGRVTFVDPEIMNRDPAAQFDLVTSGAVDGAYVLNNTLSETHPLLQLANLPLMGGSAEQTAVSLWRLHQEYLAETDYFDDAELLGFVAAPAAHIWRLNDQPVEAYQDVAMANSYPVPYFEGLDTRGPAAVREETQKMIATYNEQENGTLTYFLAHGAARAVGIWTEDRTVTEVDNGLYTPTFSVILSDTAWAQISPADQAAIRAVSGEHLAERSASWDAFDNGHRQHMLDSGLNVVKADDMLLSELQMVTATQLKTWYDEAENLGLNGAEAIMSYQEDLRSLQDKIILR